MKVKLLIYFVVSVTTIFGQKKKVFIENVTDFYTKTDTLPFFKFEKAELDTLIALNKIMPRTSEMFGVKCEDRIVFKVDRNNKIKEIKHEFTDIIIPQSVTMNDYSQYDTLKLQFQKESDRVIKITEGLWFSDSLRAEKEVRLKIHYISAAFTELNNNSSYKTKTKVNLGSPNTLLAKRDLYNYGVKKFQVKKTALAKAYFEEAIRFFPKDIDAYYNLASCYYKLKETKKACMCWEKCVELGDNTVQEQLIKYCK